MIVTIRRRFLPYRFLSALPLSSIPKTHQSNLFQCNKKIQKLGELGQVKEARQLFDSMPQRDTVTWNSMISVYIQNDSVHEAKLLFDKFKYKNVRTWTIILSGYAKSGLIEEAKNVFSMTPERNVVTWNVMLNGFIENGQIYNARKLFSIMPERNVASWNSMITGFSRRGLMEEARELFDRMIEKNCVSWMLMVSGYVEIGDCREGLILFKEMMRSGVKLEQAVLVVGMNATVGLNELVLVGSVRTVAIKLGYEGEVILGTAVLNAYTRIGSLDDAVKFFEAMPVRNQYTLTNMIAAFSQCGRLDDAVVFYENCTEKGVALRNAMLTAYMQNGRVDDARRIFDEIVSPDVVTWNAMIAGYSQNKMLEEAKDVFLQMPVRNTVSWAAMIAGFVQNDSIEEGLTLFAELHRNHVTPNNSTFTSILSACANTGDVEKGRQIHSLIIKSRSQCNSFVGNGLISMYAKCNKTGDAFQVFNTMMVRDTATWNALISGFSENDMLEDARNTFKKMPKRDAVSWSAMISAYVHVGEGDTALQLFLDMLSDGVKPKDLTFTSILSACGSFGISRIGEQFHGSIFKYGYDSCLSVCNSLITMYFECGNLGGLCVFKEMLEGDIISWNAILLGCAQNGLSTETIKMFKQMEAEGVLPDEISFSGVLCACSHASLVDEGWKYFISMSQDYGIVPSIYHYTCMVDLLGRAGQLSEAESLIKHMPIQPDCVIWETFLTACRIHRNIELSQKVAETLVQMETKIFETYVLLSNIYSSKGKCNNMQEIKELMECRELTKEPSSSWIYINKQLHCFVMGEEIREDIEGVHSALKDYYRCFKASGYVPEMNILDNVGEEQEDNKLLYHSEKLALAYGLLRAPNGAPIQIMKNRRICVDCHCFMKFISKATHRKIVIRDAHRFHRIEAGSCSCGDYW